MKKYNLFIIALACLLLISAGCSNSKDVNANLGEEFSLNIGQTVRIASEGLEIEFIEVTEDSRCPKGVTCIWAGEVTAKVAINTGKSLDELLLTEPGLTNYPPEQSFQEYKLAYHIEPYPEVGKEISADEYRLLITVSLAPKPLQTQADFTGFITEIHPVGKEGTIGQILVESHADKLVDKYMVTIKDETLIFKQDGEDRHKIAFEALETKQRVQIWFSGPIMESFPMQATARQVVVTE